MERNEALQEVRELRRIMEESRRRMPARYPIGGIIVLAAAVLAILYLPLLTPLIALALVVGGIVFHKQSVDAGERRLANIAIGIGGFALLVSLLVMGGFVWMRVAAGSTLALAGLVPALAGFIAVALIAAGVIFHRRDLGPGERLLAKATIAVGVMTLIAGALALAFILATRPSAGAGQVGDGPVPPHLEQPVPDAAGQP